MESIKPLLFLYGALEVFPSAFFWKPPTTLFMISLLCPGTGSGFRDREAF